MDLLLQTAITAALNAGEEILRIYDNPDSDLEVSKKSDNSPLTIADRKSNEIIMGYLKDTPHPVISEENKAIDYQTRRSWTTVWIVDPLDGTKEFIKRNGEFTVNIALVHDGQPVLGVIYIPVTHTLYYGTIGEGAYKAAPVGCNMAADFAGLKQRSLKLPLPREDDSFVIVASRSHASPETLKFIAGLKREHKNTRFTCIGSSIKICLVAEGSADIYPRFAPTMEWDTAAGHAIAVAAGKEMYRQDGKTPLTYNKENLSNPWFIVKPCLKEQS